MRLHSDVLKADHIIRALQNSKDAGKVDFNVQFVSLDPRGSRSRKHAYEVQLGWYGQKISGDGRRYKNSGVNGSGDVYAATYDEWGWFIDELYKLDPLLVFGHYKTRAEFHSMTRYAFGD